MVEVVKKESTVPKWNGTDETHPLWNERFNAHAEDNNFSEALQFKATDLPTTYGTVVDTTTAAGKLLEANRKKNSKAMSHLTQSFITNTAMAFV